MTLSETSTQLINRRCYMSNWNNSLIGMHLGATSRGGLASSQPATLTLIQIPHFMIQQPLAPPPRVVTRVCKNVSDVVKSYQAPTGSLMPPREPPEPHLHPNNTATGSGQAHNTPETKSLLLDDGGLGVELRVKQGISPRHTAEMRIRRNGVCACRAKRLGRHQGSGNQPKTWELSPRGGH